MKRTCLLLVATLFLVQPLCHAAGELRPNLGLETRVGETAAAPTRMQPAVDADDEEGPRNGLTADIPLEPQSFDEALQAFEKDIEFARPEVKNEHNLPFILTHGQKTKRSILMVHGLTDSPYYMRSLAQTFFDQGYNVVAVLLPGHGTKPEDLLHVRVREWRAEVEFGFNVAAQLGEEVSLAGFSTGGALVIDALNRNFTSRAEPRSIGGLYLFSPALKIANPDAYQACIPGAAVLKPWVQDNPDQIVENNPYRYNKMATNAVCQLYKQTFVNSMFYQQTMGLLAKHGVGVFAVQSQADTTVSAAAVNGFMVDAGRAGVTNEFISYPQDSHIGHADVTRPESNPAYGELTTRLRGFLARREASVPPAPLRRVELGSPEGGSLDQLRGVAGGAERL